MPRMFFAMAVAACCLPPTAAVAQQPAPPIIDMHLHALRATDQGPPPLAFCVPSSGYTAVQTGAAWRGAFMQAQKEPSCPSPLWSPETDEEVMERTIEVMERRNVYGVTSGARVDEWQRRIGHRIVPGLLFGGGPSALSVDSVRARFADGRVRVFAEVTIQYRGLEPGDPTFEPYLSLAEELDVPVGIHMGPGPPGAAYLGFGAYRGRLHSPLLLEDVMLRHPNLRLYVMHAGWPMLDDLLALMWAHPQVHVGLGVISYALPRAEFHRYLQTIVDAGFGDRVMFGSDQMVWPEALEHAIQGVESAQGLSEEQKRDILYHNAARFLRLDPAEVARHHEGR